MYSSHRARHNGVGVEEGTEQVASVCPGIYCGLTIQPPPLPEKANLTIGVAATQADYHSLFFPPLKSIDAAELDSREPVFE